METTSLPGADNLGRPPEHIRWIGVPTRNRPESLRTCLQSFGECVNKHDRNVRFLVCDQTDEQSQLEVNRQGISQIVSALNVEAWFAGRSEIRQFVTALSEYAKLPADLVTFACCGDPRFPVNTGANRNTLLLATAGEMMLQVDDDTICQVQPGPEVAEGLKLSSELFCMEHWFPSAIESLDRPYGPGNFDICALHEELLGRTLSECIAAYGPPVSKSNNWAEILCAPTPSTQISVLATSIGVSGDSQVPTNVYLLNSIGAQRERLIESEGSYRRSLGESQIETAVRQRTISDRGLVSGSNFAVDNRVLLPPFSPVQRCQDSVFAALLNACFNGCVGYLPWMIKHKRPERRICSSETTSRRSHLLSGDLLCFMIRRLATELTATTPAAKLTQLGKLFIDWSSVPAPKFQEMLRGLIVRKTTLDIAHFDALLKNYDEKPDFWAADLKLYRSWIRKTITDPELDVTDDLIDAVGTTEARAMFQQMVCKFGQLLEIWPDIHRAAAELHAQGVRVGTKL
ncbi:MAG TPA: hypothetical protein V6C69_19010 [Trichormus sp.]